MNKPFTIYWSEKAASLPGKYVETDDPVRAEQMYFKLCKKMLAIKKEGYVILHSTSHDDVPPGRFYTGPAEFNSRIWNVDREKEEVRRWFIWSMPQEIPYQRWKSPTSAMVKGLKASILVKQGARVGCEISGEGIGKIFGKSARGIRYWVAEGGERRGVDYANWRLLLEMAGFENKPIELCL